MSEGPETLRERIDATVPGRRPAHYSKRLRVVALLLVVVGVLGLVTTTMVALAPSGTGLGELLEEGKASVSGQVRTSDGDLVVGAVVGNAPSGRTSTTGVGGFYSLEGLPTGKVELRMTAPGYTTVIKRVHLERGSYTVDFLAVPGSGETVIKEDVGSGAGDPGAGKLFLVTGLAVASALALAGAVAAFLQRWFFLVLIGALGGIMTWGWFASSAISVLALIMAMPMRREFGERDKGGDLPWHEPSPHDLDEDEGEEEAMDVSPLARSGGGGGTGPGGMRPGG